MEFARFGPETKRNSENLYGPCTGTIIEQSSVRVSLRFIKPDTALKGSPRDRIVSDCMQKSMRVHHLSRKS